MWIFASSVTQAYPFESPRFFAKIRIFHQFRNSHGVRNRSFFGIPAPTWNKNTRFDRFDNFWFPLAYFYCPSGTTLYYTFVLFNRIGMDNASIKSNIEKFRKASGISQSEMAERLGLSRTAYRNIEKGKTRLLSDILKRIAEELGKTTEELMIGYEPSSEGSRKLNDIREEYRTRQTEQERHHSNEVASLLAQIKSLNDCVAALQDDVRTKNEIISMLKLRIPHEE